MIRLTAPTANGHLSVVRWGAGEPVVLLHPLAMAGELWEPVATRLAAAVYAPDLRGHGSSSWDGQPFTIEDMAVDLAQALDGLGLPIVHMLGMSMGGSVAIAFAGLYPSRVRSLVLADTTAWYGPEAPSTWADRATRATAVPRPEQVPFQVDRWFSPAFVASSPAEVQRVVDIFLRTNSEAHAAGSVAMGAMDFRPLLSSIKAPTVVLVGEDDYATPPSMASVLHQGIAGAALSVVPGLRHMTLIERPGLTPEFR
ncbi:alpha/beta fold hydrolase [Actinocrispum sp. NPDC049592]|uniref:alpha/beta fold hydrolase n=1 Tax=Actinocrispum sp. NPDC049592 TaxID=3154835 RepID=UPI003443F414